VPRGRSGTIIAAIVLAIGLGVGALGAWWVVRARPQPGDFIDAVAIPGGAVVVRGERSSDRTFVELYDGTSLRWRAMVPKYAGRPGVPAVGVSARSVTVRTVRGGLPYVFAFDAAGGAKLESFPLLDDGARGTANAYTLPHVATLSSGTGHGAEILANPDDPGGAIVIGVELDRRRQAWKGTVPWYPVDGWFAGDVLVLDGGKGRRAAFAMADGGQLVAPSGPAGLPPSPPPRHRILGDRELVVTPRSIELRDRQGAVVGTIR
jgi:hypothetical protein